MKPTNIAKFGNFPSQMRDTALADGLSSESWTRNAEAGCIPSGHCGRGWPCCLQRLDTHPSYSWDRSTRQVGFPLLGAGTWGLSLGALGRCCSQRHWRTLQSQRMQWEILASVSLKLLLYTSNNLARWSIAYLSDQKCRCRIYSAFITVL